MSSKGKIIGISGKMKAGKDLSASIIKWLMYRSDNNYADKHVTLEDYLDASHMTLPVDNVEPTYFMTYYFADVLKRVCNKLANDHLAHFYREKPKMEQMQPPFERFSRRTFMTSIGEALCNVDPDIFVKHLGAVRKKVEYENWLIPDVRFENELKFVNDNDGFVIRVERPLIDRHGYFALEDVKSKDADLYQKLMNRSETSLDMYDFGDNVVFWSDDIHKLKSNLYRVLVKNGIINAEEDDIVYE